MYHRRFDAHRDGYRPSLREWVETGERRAMSAEEYVAAQGAGCRRPAPGRRGSRSTASTRFSSRRSRRRAAPRDRLRPRGDDALISLTHLWDWTGFPVAALPAGVGRAGLPVGVSLIGPAGGELGRCSRSARQLQAELGVPELPALAAWSFPARQRLS